MILLCLVTLLCFALLLFIQPLTFLIFRYHHAIMVNKDVYITLTVSIGCSDMESLALGPPYTFSALAQEFGDKSVLAGSTVAVTWPSTVFANSPVVVSRV